MRGLGVDEGASAANAASSDMTGDSVTYEIFAASRPSSAAYASRATTIAIGSPT
ncbi:hypothetical protein ACQ86D_01965 [Streptomyces galilaeus]